MVPRRASPASRASCTGQAGRSVDRRYAHRVDLSGRRRIHLKRRPATYIQFLSSSSFLYVTASQVDHHASYRYAARVRTHAGRQRPGGPGERTCTRAPRGYVVPREISGFTGHAMELAAGRALFDTSPKHSHSTPVNLQSRRILRCRRRSTAAGWQQQQSVASAADRPPTTPASGGEGIGHR